MAFQEIFNHLKQWLNFSDCHFIEKLFLAALLYDVSIVKLILVNVTILIILKP